MGLKAAEDIVKLWNSCIGTVYPMDMKLFEHNLSADINWKKILCCYDDERLAGFIIYKQWTEKSGEIEPKRTFAYINSLCVDIGYRGRGIGTKLLAGAEEELQGRGAEKIYFGADHFHFFPGVPMEAKGLEDFISKRGYETSKAQYDMICDLTAGYIDSLLKPLSTEDGNVSICVMKPEYREELFSFLKRSFGGRWYGEIIRHYSMGMEDRDLVVIKNGNEIAGFCHIYDCKSKTLGPGIYWRKLLGQNFGGLGPLGISKDIRGRGLGLELLKKSILLLKEREVHNMVIDWTTLVEFYGKLGFVPWKMYKDTEKTL